MPDKQHPPGLTADAAQGLRYALRQILNQQAANACDSASCAAQVLWYKLRDANPDASAQEVLAELARRLDDMRIQARNPAVKAGRRGAVSSHVRLP